LNHSDIDTKFLVILLEISFDLRNIYGVTGNVKILATINTPTGWPKKLATIKIHH